MKLKALIQKLGFVRKLEDLSNTKSIAIFFSQSPEARSTSYFDTTSVFLMQMACILNMTAVWKKRSKLRIFLCVEPGQDSGETPGVQELEVSR